MMKIRVKIKDNKEEVENEAKELNEKFETDGFYEKKEAEAKMKGKDIEVTIKSKKKFKPKN
jgi:hypothetical protein